MGWNVQGDASSSSSSDEDGAKFLDSMDAENYVAVSLPKPMGIIFEENDVTSTLNPGGIYVFELSPGGHAASSDKLQFGDQLVGVVTPGKARVVAGEDFDVAISAIKGAEEEEVKLVLFRGPCDALYGPTGASKEWLSEFVQGHA